MAKAKEITGLDCGADALLWAAEVLRVRCAEVVELRRAALDFSDVEGVHGMRVATRRLRSALRDFLPLMRKQSLKSARRDFKQIADALGAVRDADVAILALEKLQTEAEDETIRQGIERLLAERNQTREPARADLIVALDASRLAAVQIDFVRALEKTVRKSKQSGGVSFTEAGRRAVGDALAELWELGASLYEPANVEMLHDCRIAAKRLRYAIELFTACWGAAVAPFAGEIAEMQGFLGEVHDCDVWIEDLGRRLRTTEADENGSDDYLTAVWLLDEFVKKRLKNYRAALKLWSEWQTTDFRAKMQTVVRGE